MTQTKHNDVQDSPNISEDSDTLPAPDNQDVKEIELDDSVWEDVSNVNLAKPDEKGPPPPSLTASSRDSSVRKRRGRTQFIARANTPRRALVKLRNSRENTSPLVEIDTARVTGAIANGATDSVSYFLDVFARAMRFLRYPFAILLAFWLFAFVLTKLSATFRTVVAPLCWVPGFSRIPMCHVGEKKVAQWADFPKLVDVQSATFEQLLDESVHSQGLSLQVKKAELATQDLITLVKISDLKSRDLLANTLVDFVQDAKKTGRSLQKFGAKVAGAVDTIIAINDHALHTIEQHNVKSSSALSVIWPFSSKAAAMEAITQTFTDAMSVNAAQVARVILEAEVALANLDSLEERLISLQELLRHEDQAILAERSELLAELWTILGGNKRKVRKIDGHLFLLRGIGQYRTRALAHVAAAMETLQGMGQDMEDLRERVATPELVGDRIPVEVHMKSIKVGLERLKEKRYQVKGREEAAVREILGRVD